MKHKTNKILEAAEHKSATIKQRKPTADEDAAEDIEETETVAKPNAADDPVFAKYGEPFIINAKGTVHLNERAVAVKCATENQVKYDPTRRVYQRFDQRLGLWPTIHEVEVRRLVGDLLLRLGKEWHQEEFVQRNKTSQFNSLCKMLQPYQVDVATEDTTGMFHVANGVLKLQGKTPKLMPHDPKYPFRFSALIKYNAKAKCPKFLKQLLGAALAADDIALLQKYCGSMLLGPNTCHGILFIRGRPGGGKSTSTSVFEKVLGEENVAHLRTKHLTGRFETSAFIGKRVLVGKDVPGNTLTENGAQLLKSLVGGDLLQAEIKYNPAKQAIRGDYHIIIVSNNRLRITLDGDEEAWRRRLLVVDFEKPKPAKPIPNFAERLVAEEGSGILNWLIEGAAAYRDDMDKLGHIRLTEKQQQRVATLLHDSDSVLSFVEQCVIKQEKSDVSSEELLLRYHAHCKEQRWTPVSMHPFQIRIHDVLCQRFIVCRTHDITREGKAVRGYKGLALK
jgi:P4 family phage/plasmid primase-like protien